MKALLLRVGIDKGCGGYLSPIFTDGSFEYIPIPEGDENSKESRTYGNTMGTNGKYFVDYLNPNLNNSYMHFDPEFETYTYGDPTVKRNTLSKLDPNDLLIFYAGLTPWQNKVQQTGCYIIGYFTVQYMFDCSKLSNKEIDDLYHQYSNNAHMKRANKDSKLVLVVGDPKQSGLLRKAICISQIKNDKMGKPYYAVSEDMEKMLGIHGSIQRSIPIRIISENRFIANLKSLIKP